MKTKTEIDPSPYRAMGELFWLLRLETGGSGELSMRFSGSAHHVSIQWAVGRMALEQVVAIDEIVAARDLEFMAESIYLDWRKKINSVLAG